MATGRKSSPNRKSKVASKRNAWIWTAQKSWLILVGDTRADGQRHCSRIFEVGGGLFLGPFMALTGLR